MHAGRVLHHRGRIFHPSETGHLHQRRLLLAEREWKVEENKEDRGLQQERGRRAFNEKEAKEEMRSSTSASRIIDRKLLCANRNVETLDRGSKMLCHHRSDSIDLLRSDGPDLEWFNSVRSSDSKPLVNEEECEEVEDCKSREGRHGGSVELVSSLEIKA